MDIIAKNHILNWINQYSEAKSELLVWLRGISFEKYLAREEQVITISATLGTGPYSAKIQVNKRLNTAYISAFGTKEEFDAAERERIKVLYPNEKIITKTFSFSAKASDIKKVAVPKVNYIYDTLAPIQLTDLTPDAEITFKTPAGYEQALARAISIFDARPGRPEFEELEALLPQIKAYEYKYIELPQLSPLQVIQQKVTMLKMEPVWLSQMTGIAEADIESFLKGEKMLTKKQIRDLYKKLFVRFVR